MYAMHMEEHMQVRKEGKGNMQMESIQAKYYLIVDFEMCMLKGRILKHTGNMKHEIIQIGAILMNEKYQIEDSFSSYVSPEYGKVDPFIENLTGISQEDLAGAPALRTVLMKLAAWLGGRSVVTLSWSDVDYYQLKKEMHVKKIKNTRIKSLFKAWVDFQAAFGNMLHLQKTMALENAMKISCMDLVGRQHDGLFDAYNTARLFEKIHRQSTFTLVLIPIRSLGGHMDHLSFKLGELLTADILDDLPREEADRPRPDPLLVSKDTISKRWSFWRRLYSMWRGKDAASDENWNKLRFTYEMKKLGVIETFRGCGRRRDDAVSGMILKS